MGADTAINLGGLLIAVVTLFGGGIWQITRSQAKVIEHQNLSEQRIMAAIGDHRAEVDDKIGRIYDRIESESRAIGEIVQALRQHINDIKIQALETFVRRDSFHQFLEDQREARRNFEADIKERLTDLHKKIDRLVERQATGGS